MFLHFFLDFFGGAAYVGLVHRGEAVVEVQVDEFEFLGEIYWEK